MGRWKELPAVAKGLVLFGLLIAVLIFFLFLESIGWIGTAEAGVVNDLQWDAPVAFINGATLDPQEIDGYNFFCGNASGVYTVETPISNATLVPISTVTGALSGTIFCAVKTRLIYDGRLSDSYSNEVDFIERNGNFFVDPGVNAEAPGNLRITK